VRGQCQNNDSDLRKLPMIVVNFINQSAPDCSAEYDTKLFDGAVSIGSLVREEEVAVCL